MCVKVSSGSFYAPLPIELVMLSSGAKCGEYGLPRSSTPTSPHSLFTLHSLSRCDTGNVILSTANTSCNIIKNITQIKLIPFSFFISLPFRTDIHPVAVHLLTMPASRQLSSSRQNNPFWRRPVLRLMVSVHCDSIEFGWNWRWICTPFSHFILSFTFLIRYHLLIACNFFLFFFLYFRIHFCCCTCSVLYCECK